MEFIVKELFAATQATDTALDQLQKTAQEIRDRGVTAKSEVIDTIALLPELIANADIKAITLNTAWCVTWAVTFAAAFTFYAGQATAEAWRTRNHAAIRTEICTTPDSDLDELVLPILSMVAAHVDIVELGAEADDLTTLTAHQLRPLCQSRGIQWRNALGHGKHLPKAQMIAALTC